MGNAKRKERKKAGEKFVHPPKEKNSKYKGPTNGSGKPWSGEDFAVMEAVAKHVLQNYGGWQERNKWY